MDDEPKSKSWWLTLPGVLTAIAAIISAVTGLIVALHQMEGFKREHRQPPQAQYDTTKPKGATNAPSAPGVTPDTTLPTHSASPTKYPINLPVANEIRVGPIGYKFLAAQVDRYSEDKLSLRFSIRFTNIEVPWGVNIGPDSFRLLIDGVPLAPKESPIEVVAFQSATEGDILFLIPTSASNIVLQVGDITIKNAAKTKIPINLKTTPD